MPHQFQIKRHGRVASDAELQAVRPPQTMNRASQSALVLIGILLTLLTACATRDKGYLEDSDPEMAAAVAKAQATLPQFWQVFDQRAGGESNFVLAVSDHRQRTY